MRFSPHQVRISKFQKCKELLVNLLRSIFKRYCRIYNSVGQITACEMLYMTSINMIQLISEIYHLKDVAVTRMLLCSFYLNLNSDTLMTFHRHCAALISQNLNKCQDKMRCIREYIGQPKSECQSTQEMRRCIK